MPAQLNASPDFLLFVIRINTKLETVIARALARTGGMQFWGQKQTRLMLLARDLVKRFAQDNYTATIAEWGAMKELFDWLAEQHALNENMPAKPVTWNDDGMFQGKHLKRGTYEALCIAFARGELDDADSIRLSTSGLVLPGVG
jgi:hypothetical protein